jgi:uncharacterized protein YggE
MKILAKTVFCALLIISLFSYAHAESNNRCCEEEYPKLVVQGEGKIETLPDKATFFIKIRVEEKKLERAFEVSTKRINSVSETLASLEVKKEDIKNLGYTYQPLYEGKKIFTTIDRPSSYEVLYTLKVAIYKLESLGKILSGLSEVQETTVYGLDFTSTKIEELKKEALKKAAADAREKAQKLAEGAGAALGKVLKIDTGAPIYPVRSYAMRAEKAIAEQAAAPVPQIESGTIEITANCTVSYSIQ